MKRNFNSHKITAILAMVCLALGLIVLLYQPLKLRIVAHCMDQEIKTFERAVESVQQRVEASQTEHTDAVEYQELRMEMEQYNETLFQTGQSGLTDAWSYEQSAFDLSEFGLSTDVLGVLHLPGMGEDLPIYLGATEEHLSKGVAILGQTSMPVDGNNVNCVIAGHRGYRGIPFFRDIEKLKSGDMVSIDTYFGEKIYEVESTAIISPDDTEAVLIQEGRDLLTLVTCHPYAVGTHRYVVYCEAVGGTETDSGATEDTIHSTPMESQADGKTHTEPVEELSSQNRIDLEQWLPYLGIPLVIASIILVIWPTQTIGNRQKRRKTSDHAKNS